jgi:hypothetical protein
MARKCGHENEGSPSPILDILAPIFLPWVVGRGPWSAASTGRNVHLAFGVQVFGALGLDGVPVFGEVC